MSYDILYQGYMSCCHMMFDPQQNLHIDLEAWTANLLNMEDMHGKQPTPNQKSCQVRRWLYTWFIVALPYGPNKPNMEISMHNNAYLYSILPFLCWIWLKWSFIKSIYSSSAFFKYVEYLSVFWVFELNYMAWVALDGNNYTL